MSAFDFDSTFGSGLHSAIVTATVSATEIESAMRSESVSDFD